MAVTPDDIAVELGRPTPVDSATADQWSLWIARTVRRIERKATRLGVDPATLDPEVLDEVVLLAVAEHARNPEGVDTYDINVDDGRESRRFRRSEGRITISDEWWGWLFPSLTSEAFSTRMSGEPDVWGDRYPSPVTSWPSGI